ncbi:2-amino-4-hydroxy-6-hydroxymethyldihydropteridine diphosphokinase [Salinibacterium sp. dk2585]|nr:2-amino-4-hydroxy-6-hydroxymethyldihydropteridine diphosphokinase [Salinibacterium sp. dk2585]TXK56093.1 2-amino-4-hydroxy-6-hydroxymethyldihydropteridine diphosphokinase [Salinibacterium sp. dk5596]
MSHLDAHRERAVIALGSNLGDREGTLRSAVLDVAATSGVHLVGASELFETPALTLEGVDESAPSYLNAIVIAETPLAPLVLLDRLNEIEDEHGRVREVRWGDRTLDLDLIAYGELTLSTARLTLPHPRAHERDFVLAPWLQADPDASLPGFGRVQDLLARMPVGGVKPIAAAPLLARPVGES